MADDFTFKIDRKGLEKLAKGKDMRAALAFIGGIAETKAKELAPVDTGNLRRSITHEVGEDGKGLYARYGTNVFYGIYQELGTRFHPPTPFLRPVLPFIQSFLKRQ